MRPRGIVNLAQWLGLLLLGMALSACEASTPPSVVGTPAATSPLSMPLPRSEMTRVAALAFTPTPSPRPQRTPAATATQFASPTPTPSASPSPSPAPPSPTATLVPNRPEPPQATLEAAPPVATSQPQPTPQAASRAGPLLMWLCASVFGALLLVLAAAMVAVQQKRRQSGSLRYPPLISQLKPGQTWAEVFGQVKHVPRPLTPDGLAGLRLRIEVPDGKGGWKTLLERSRLTSFYLSDEGGSILVEADGQDIRFIGEGHPPTEAQLHQAWSALGMGPLQNREQEYRLSIWEVRQGQQIGVSGNLAWHRVLNAFQVGSNSAGGPPAPISTLKAGDQALVRGYIAEVPTPLDRDTQRPLTMLRLLVREYQPQTGWVTLIDQRRTALFRLKEGEAAIWVKASPQHLTFSGRGTNLPLDQLPAYLHLLGLSALPSAGRRLQCTLWTYRKGDLIQVSGQVEEVPTLRVSELDTLLTRPPLMSIGALQPGQGPVRVNGRITRVAEALDEDRKTPLAILRLLIEEQGENGWKKRLDETRSAPFMLDDGSGSIWVQADKLDTESLGEGIYTSALEAEKALLILKRPLSLARGKGLRYRLWKVRQGDRITVCGQVVQQMVLSDMEERKPPVVGKMVASPAGQKQPRPATLGMIGALITFGGGLLCLSLFNLIRVLLGG